MTKYNIGDILHDMLKDRHYLIEDIRHLPETRYFFRLLETGELGTFNTHLMDHYYEGIEVVA